MHDAQAMQVGDSTKDLAHQVAGILLCVGATFHDAVKELSPCHPEGRRGSVDPGPLALTHCPAPSLSLPSSQLHGQVEMGRALVDVLQSHDVGVADPAQQEKALMGRCRPLCASVLPPASAPFPTIGHPCAIQQGRAPVQAFLGTQRRQGTPPQDTALKVLMLAAWPEHRQIPAEHCDLILHQGLLASKGLLGDTFEGNKV